MNCLSLSRKKTQQALHWLVPPLLLVCLPVTAAAAQTGYPSKPVRLIVPYPAGGANDIVGRQFAERMTDQFGKQWVVDNRGGAGGLVGTTTAANAHPDGHTLLLAAVFFTMSPAIHKLQYDPIKSFERVAMFGTSSAVLAVNPGIGVNSVRDLIALAKTRPGKITFGSAGIGSFSHFSAELFRSMAKLDMVHVPYNGAAASMLDAIAGRIDWLTGSPNQFLPHFKAGRLRAIATGGEKRMSILPQTPTVSESGLPGYVANNWWGILAPAGTPTAIINRLNTASGTFAQSADTRDRLLAQGIEPSHVTPQEFTRLIASDIEKWRNVAQAANIRNE